MSFNIATIDLADNPDIEEAVSGGFPLAAESGVIVTHLAVVPDADWLEQRQEVSLFLLALAEEMADRGAFSAQDESVRVGVERIGDGYWATFTHDCEHVVSFVGVSSSWFDRQNFPPETATCDGCQNAFPLDEIEVLGNAEHGPFGLCKACMTPKGDRQDRPVWFGSARIVCRNNLTPEEMQQAATETDTETLRETAIGIILNSDLCDEDRAAVLRALDINRAPTNSTESC